MQPIWETRIRQWKRPKVERGGEEEDEDEDEGGGNLFGGDDGGGGSVTRSRTVTEEVTQMQEPPPTGAAIELKPWDPKVPYMNAIVTALRKCSVNDVTTIDAAAVLLIMAVYEEMRPKHGRAVTVFL